MKIYALMTGDLVLYVGRTNKSLKDRAICHKTPSNKAYSKYITDDWEIVLLDKVPDEEGAKWERHYYDTLDPLYNKSVPGRTASEWYADNREDNIQKKIEWQEKNRVKWLTYLREYNRTRR